MERDTGTQRKEKREIHRNEIMTRMMEVHIFSSLIEKEKVIFSTRHSWISGKSWFLKGTLYFTGFFSVW